MVIDFIARAWTRRSSPAPTCYWLLGENPEVWQRLRRDPELVPAAVVRAVPPLLADPRLHLPLSRDAEVGGVRMRAGDRAVLLFGAANIDSAAIPIRSASTSTARPAATFGSGPRPHTCVGIHLAKLEMAALLRALLAQVEAIEIAGPPTEIRNNTLQGIASLPVRLA